jgi:myo-inositol-1(or 4)-monophosphatase
MADFDLEKVLAMAGEAGELAQKYFGHVTVQRKADSSLVTQADREVEQMVRERLAEITPDWPVLGEEAGQAGGKIDRSIPFWVVDPVDGTSSFISGLPTWCFSLGLIDNGRARFGVIDIPITGERYYTDPDGRQAYRNGALYPAEEPLDIDKESILYIQSDSHRGYKIDYPGKIRALGSAAYHGILAGRARTAGVVQGRVYLWDGAGCMAIAAAWGIRIGDLDGNEIKIDDWGLQQKCPAQMLFAHRKHYDYIRGRIEPLYGKDKRRKE